MDYSSKKPLSQITLFIEECRNFAHNQEDSCQDFDFFCQQSYKHASQLSSTLQDLETKQQTIKIVRKNSIGTIIFDHNNTPILENFGDIIREVSKN